MFAKKGDATSGRIGEVPRSASPPGQTAAPAEVPASRGAPAARSNAALPPPLFATQPAIVQALRNVAAPWVDDDGPAMGTELDDEDLAGLPVRSARDAGMVPDRHHHFPQELERSGFYQERGFAKGEIHEYTSEFAQGDHQALHGGGNYKLAKEHWPEGTWNERFKMDTANIEAALRRKMTREELLAYNMKLRKQFNVADEPLVHYRKPR